MLVPPLSFLRSPANIDRVACSAMDNTRKRDRAARTIREPKTAKPTSGNSFSGVRGLDLRLRPALEEAGFGTQDYNDRYLLAIQFNAIAIAQGKRIFMGESKAKEMAVWAAKALYAE
jgi:hypothetical protein